MDTELFEVRPDGQQLPDIQWLDAVAAPVFLLDNGTIQYANSAAIDLAGLNLELLKGSDLRQILRMNEATLGEIGPLLLGHQESGEVMTGIETLAGGEVPVRLVFKRVPVPEAEPSAGRPPAGRKPDSALVMLTVAAVGETNRTLSEVVELWRDLKEHDLLMAENLRQKDLLQKVFEVDPGGLAVISGPDLVIRMANPTYRASLPDPASNPVGRLYTEIWAGSPHENSANLLRRVIESGQSDQFDRFDLGASERYFSIRAHPLLWEGEPGVLVVMWETTELAHRRMELESLMTVAFALRDAIVQDEMFPIILSHVLSLLRMQGASLLMHEPVTNDIVVRLGIGLWAPVTGLRLPAGEGISAQVLLSGKPYLNNQIQEDPRLARSVFIGDLTCGACVPLSSHGMTIGAVWMGRMTPISEEEVGLLTTIADIASSNLYRARLFEQTQLRFQRLSALHSIDMAITSSLDLNLTLSVLLDQVVSQMRVDAADILLFDPAMHWLDFASGRGFLQPQARMEPQRLSQSPAGQVAMERRLVSIPDLDQTEIPKTVWLDPIENFHAYFAAPLIAKGQVKGVIELFTRDARQPDVEWLEFLETLATQAAIAIDGAELFERLQRSNEELMVAYDATIEGWSHALELRDHETHGHAQRVTELTIRLARRMGVREEDIPHYRRGVLLHDIGKMAVPDSILLKEGPLTPAEQEVMRRHPVYAYELLYPIAYLRPALDIPYSHHEWWDGTGYPRGLKGEEIPLSARTFAVVDVWDALCSDRNYRPAWPVHKVIEHIRSMSGAHFDPRVVEEFLKMVQNTDRFRYSRF